MKYRVYIDGTAGYYQIENEHTPENTTKILDSLIFKEKTKEKILVIECNKEDRIEFPVFLYLGREEDYTEFREYLLSDKQQDKVTKQFRKK